jgi:hypothetical protein
MTGSDCATTVPAGDTAVSSLDDIGREFPAWHLWEGISGMLYASLRSSPPLVVRGSDPKALRAAILRALEDI